MRTEQRESPWKLKLSGLLCVVQVQGFCGKAAKSLAHFTRALRCSCENTHCLHVWIVQKRLKGAVFARLHSKAVRISRSGDLFSRHEITKISRLHYGEHIKYSEISRAFSRKIYNNIERRFLKKGEHEGAVSDVALDKTKVRVFHRRCQSQRCQVRLGTDTATECVFRLQKGMERGRNFCKGGIETARHCP